jgi:hypothetical protein
MADALHSFGLIPAARLEVPSPLIPNQSADVSLLLATGGPNQKMDPLTTLQIAVKNHAGVYYFQTIVPLHVFFTEDGSIDHTMFTNCWNDPNVVSLNLSFNGVKGVLPDLLARLSENNVYGVGNQNPNESVTFDPIFFYLYIKCLSFFVQILNLGCRLTNGGEILFQFKHNASNGQVQVIAKAAYQEYLALLEKSFKAILQA